MTTFRTILTREAERVWKDGKDKNKNNLEHLERKWRNNPRPEVEGLWRRVKIGDFELEDEMAAEENEVRGAPARIYIFTHYPGPKFTQPTFTQKPQVHNTKFTRNHIFTTSNLHNPILYKPKYTQPQNKTKHATLGVAQGSSVQPAGRPA